jgi:hypothetical protein
MVRRSTPTAGGRQLRSAPRSLAAAQARRPIPAPAPPHALQDTGDEVPIYTQ